MEMTKGQKFKVAFLSLTAGIFAFIMVKGLFEVDLSDSAQVTKLALKGLVTAVVVGALLGAMDMYMGIFPFKQRNK